MKKEQPLISVLVPIYQVFEYLPECINSILNQTYRKIEVILIHDGSSVEELQLCREFEKKDGRVIVIDQKHGGLIKARKSGAFIATGEYVACVDGDDWIEPDLLQRLLETEQKADVYSFCYLEECEGYQGIKRNLIDSGLYTQEKGLEEFWSRMMMDERILDQGVFSSICNKLIRRDIYLKNQLSIPDEITYGEDAACTFPCLLDAKSVYVLNTPLYHYRMRADSCVRSAEIDCKSFKSLYLYLSKCFSGRNNTINLMRQLHLYMWQILLLKAYDRVESGMALFPFYHVRKGMKIILYGAGLFGQAVERVCRLERCLEVISWLDQRYEVYRQQGLPVSPITSLRDMEFDMIVITVTNRKIAGDICDNLVKMGIDKRKIDCIDLEMLSEMPLPGWLT